MSLQADPLSLDYAITTIRRDIVALLARDPHCPIANLLGQELMDLMAERWHASQ